MKKRMIYCENVIEQMWKLFLYFENEPVAKEHLYHSYCRLQDEKSAHRLAYENTTKFIYYIKQGVAYFQSALDSELIVRPLLLFYGMTSLMKSILLLKDPHYPQTTIVLQHGLTTRKKKKNHYVFHNDDIKIQKEGLVPYFSRMVLDYPLPVHRKYKVVQLLSLFPELQDSYELLFKHRTMVPVQIDHKDSDSIFTFSEDHFTCYQSQIMTVFSSGISDDDEPEISLSPHHKTENHKAQTYSLKVKKRSTPFRNGCALILENYWGHSFFYLKQPISVPHEIIAYSMLMYMLSMLCRYDTEIWGELLFSFSSSDIFIIEEFLQLSVRKIPNIILNHLFEETIILRT